MRTIVCAGIVALVLTGCGIGARPAESPAPQSTPTVITADPTGPPATVPPTPSVSLPPVTPPTPSPTPQHSPLVVTTTDDGLQASFARFAAAERGRVSIAVGPVGTDADPTVFGDLGRPVAWSTSKVPLAIAVERTPQGPGLRPTMRQAITASDNDAASRLWQSLGQPAAAAAATDRVLRDFGDGATRTQAQQVRPPYTAFGQTQWGLADQTRFAGQLPCRAEAAEVYAAMGAVIPSQQWGLGRVPQSHFKGGWGPSATGYLVRQFGVLETRRGQVAVAVAVEAPSFDQGTVTLSRAAQWLAQHLEELPAGSC
ncbi:hypothetical protein [Granulicoccus sp. GXG6511]|uniref:hypothetical protein n=1 Tax=Granulicoccus sp. GXG6511 TaxID=3381351 RepID=UPI003D7DD62D